MEGIEFGGGGLIYIHVNLLEVIVYNAPHIRHLQFLHMGFILGVKSGGHAALFDWVKQHDEMSCLSAQEGNGKTSESFSYASYPLGRSSLT